VRRLRVDSSTFVADSGAVSVRFEVSRAARTRTRVVGQGIDVIVDSQIVAAGAPAQFDWPALNRGGQPLPEGRYEIITTAVEGEQNEFSTPPHALRIIHARRDTLAQLTTLPGYTEQPEMVAPPRDWRPMLLSVLYTGLAAGSFLAIERGELGTGPRTALIAAGGVGLTTGFVLSLRQADPRPSASNILYNQLLRELLAKRNAEIAQANEARRKQVLVTVVPAE
jgi:hypothetical protein